MSDTCKLTDFSNEEDSQNLKNRKGFIKISKELWDFLIEQPSLLKNIFSNFYPISIEFNPLDNRFTYYGYSLCFDEIEEDSPPLQYLFLMENNGEVSIEKIEHI